MASTMALNTVHAKVEDYPSSVFRLSICISPKHIIMLNNELTLRQLRSVLQWVKDTHSLQRQFMQQKVYHEPQLHASLLGPAAPPHQK